MKLARGIACFALGLLAMISSAAGEPGTIAPEGSRLTRLEIRLAALRGTHANAPGSAVFWKEARDMILASNAAEDARADAASGNAGFMTHANNAIAESPVAPGLKCHDRSEPSRRSVYLFAYHDPVAPEAGKALLAFDAYARAYNAIVSRSGELGETSCTPAGW